MIFSVLQIGGFSVSANDSGATTLFYDDFTDYSLAQWNAKDNYGSPSALSSYNIDPTSGNATVKSTLTNNIVDAWIFNKSATTDISGNGYIGIVDASTEGVSDASSHGKILKYRGEGTTTSFGVQRNVLNTTKSATIGNTLKYSYDIFVPGDFYRKHKSFYLPGISSSRAKYATNDSRIGMELYNDGSMVAMGGYGSNGDYNTDQSVGLLKSKDDFTGAWHNITVVVNNPGESSASNPFTWRLYIDGKLQSVSKPTALREFDGKNNISYDIPNFKYDGTLHYTIPSASKGGPASTFYGLSFGEQGNATVYTGAVYFDNIKAELVDTKFVLSSTEGASDAFAVESGSIKLNFSTPLITAVDTDFAGYDYKNNIKVIISNHDFNKTPNKEEIIERLCKMQELNADLPKIAVMPKTPSDVLILLSATNEMVTKYADRPIITMSMAGDGLISRISGEVFGSALTFGSAKKASAPGQIPVSELSNILNVIHTNL